MLHFLKAAMMYVYAFVNVKTLRQHMDPGTIENYKHARRHQELCAETLGKVYSKIVLQCSNFERPKEDESFFECIFYFTASVVKLGLATEYWKDAETELGFIFRGESYNVNLTSHERQDYLPSIQAEQEDQSNAKESQDRVTEPVVESIRGIPVSDTTNVATTVARVAAVKDRAMKNIQYAQHVRESMIEKRSKQLKRQMDILKASDAREAQGIGLRSPMRPINAKMKTASLIPSRPSIRNTLTARSPAIANILPTAQDRIYMTQRKMIQKRIQAKKQLRIGYVEN